MTDRTHPDSGRIITSSDILLHDAETALLYEELRAAIDDGHESMTHSDALAEIAAIRAENTELRAQLEAIGAGGVSGPLVGQPQAMPDWVQYEETSDVLIVHGKRYAAGIFGKAGFLGPPGTLLRVECGDADCVTLARVPPSANAGEPRALNPRHIRKFLQALQAGEMSVSRAVEILDAWVGGYYEDEMVPLPPPDSCLIADDEFPMEIVRKLRSELAAAPPTAQAEGWTKASEQLPPCRDDQIYIGVNSAGYAGVFNAIASIAGNVHCMYETPEETIDVMSDLAIWKPFNPPTSAEGVGS